MRRLTPWTVFLLCMAIATPAWAETSVVVLGMRSIEGDDAVGTALTDALRAASTTVNEWRVEERGPTMSQMSMAYGCDEVDARCLTDIAAGLEVDLIVYGSVRRTSTRDNYDYSLTLSLFNAPAGAIEKSVTERVLRANVEAGALATQASELIGKLTGQATRVELGALRVMLNITTGATITIDGTPAGDAAGGSFVLEGVSPGAHSLTVEAEGYELFEASFSVTAGDPTRVAANLTPLDGSEPPPPITAGASYEEMGTTTDSGGGLPTWLPYALLGTAGAGLIGTVVSWVIVDGVNNDALFKEYSGGIYDQNQAESNTRAKVTDVCDHAQEGLGPTDFAPEDLREVQDMCATGVTFEVLQWVFLGTTVIAGGLGTYLLISQSSDSASGAQPTFALSPTVGRDRGGVSATVRF